MLGVSCVPALEGFLRGVGNYLFVALVAARYAAGRADISVTLRTWVHVPVVILFGICVSGLDNQRLPTGVAELHAVLCRSVLMKGPGHTAVAVPDSGVVLLAPLARALAVIKSLIRCVQVLLQGVTLAAKLIDVVLCLINDLLCFVLVDSIADVLGLNYALAVGRVQ
ncbi:hypothetical protein [Pseudomonas sp. FW305-70]|uniref:hypothetical protein n=1 Tax=Pseudomonas sp. FW305-70 TaxID=2751342 RepID=UPI0013049C11|nr:hypothetical protein [Pseudomonas sp. FW305-70]